MSNWNDIVAIAAGHYYTVGLRSDGTVVATGKNTGGQCDVSDWRNIIEIATGVDHTVGLCADGTVVTTGKHQDIISTWREIATVVASDGCTAGIRTDGRVQAISIGTTSGWNDIVALSLGFDHVVGLCADGTVVATGDNKDGQCNVSDWQHIVAVIAGYFFTVGLCSDGTVVATGFNNDGRCNVNDWKLFDSIDTLEREYRDGLEKAKESLLQYERKMENERLEAAERNKEAKQKADEEKVMRRTRLEEERTALQVEIANLKGLFSGKRRKELETRLQQIEEELEVLQ